MRIDPDANLVSAATVGDSPTPIPWGEPFSKRLVLEQIEAGARLTGAPEPPAFKLYTYQALFALVFAVSLLGLSRHPPTDPGLIPIVLVLIGGLGFGFMGVAEAFVWRSAPGRSSFPRVASSIEVRGEIASADKEPYRAAATHPRLDAVVIDGHVFPADQVEGVRLVDWRTREVDPKYGYKKVETLAVLVLIATDDDGRRVPYELDVFVGGDDDEDAAVAACRLLAGLLGMKPLETVHLPLNAGLHQPWYSVVGYRIMSMLMNAGVMIAAGTSFPSSTRTQVICVVAWVVLSSAIIRWHSNREMWRRNIVASKAAKPHRTSKRDQAEAGS